jgi:hypothetical protein
MTTPNKSLDASGGSVFRNYLGTAKGALIRAAASTQTFGVNPILRSFICAPCPLLFSLSLWAWPLRRAKSPPDNVRFAEAFQFRDTVRDTRGNTPGFSVSYCEAGNDGSELLWT